MKTLIFQISHIVGNTAFGAIKELTKEPRRDDYFVATGEVAFQGGYQDTGRFNDSAFEHDRKLWSFQSCPIGKYHERQFTIPEGVELTEGQFVKVSYEDLTRRDADTLKFYKDRVRDRVIVKKFTTWEEEQTERRKNFIF